MKYRRAVTATLAILLISTGILCPSIAAWAAFRGANGKIAFMMNSSFAGPEAGLYTINPDGSGLTKLLSVPASPHSGGPPKWSPDGTKIAFDAEFGGFDQIYVINADGTGLTQLTFSPAGENHVTRESPDGARIVLSSNHGVSSQEIMVMNADGTGIVNLTNSPTSDEFQPDWSSDGSRIVFDSYAAGSGTQDVWIMDTDGSEQADLTPGTEASFDGAATWSPDGTKLAFHSTREGNVEVFVMNSDGTGVTRLTEIPTSVSGLQLGRPTGPRLRS